MKLSTGREFYANGDIVGIAPDGLIYEGYDGDVWEERFTEGNDAWTDADRLALAKMMIARWQAYEDKVRENAANRDRG